MHALLLRFLASVAILAPGGILIGQTADMALRLTTLEQAFDAAAGRDALAPRNVAVVAATKSYLSALERALAAATQAGKLDDAVALRTERDRVTNGQPITVGGKETVSEVLKPLRENASAALSKIDEDYLKRLRPLLDRYDQALAALQVEVTKAGKIDDGLHVKNLRDRVAKARVSGDITVLSESLAGTSSGAVPTVAKVSIKSAKELERFLPGTSWAWVVPGSTRTPDNLRFDENGEARLGALKPAPWKVKDSKTVEWNTHILKFNREYTEFETTISSGPRFGKRVSE